VHDVLKLLSAIRKKMVAKVNSRALVLSNLQPNQYALKAMALVMATTKTMVTKVNKHALVLSNGSQLLSRHLKPRAMATKVNSHRPVQLNQQFLIPNVMTIVKVNHTRITRDILIARLRKTRSGKTKFTVVKRRRMSWPGSRI